MTPNTFLAPAFSKGLISADNNILIKKRREISGVVRQMMDILFTGVVKLLLSATKWMEAAPAPWRVALKTPWKAEVLEVNEENWRDGGKRTNWIWVFWNVLHPYFSCPVASIVDIYRLFTPLSLTFKENCVYTINSSGNCKQRPFTLCH